MSAKDLTLAELTQCTMLCDYIRNTGQVPLRPDDFDDDWEPVGALYREWLLRGGFIEQREHDAETGEPGGIYLTPTGRELAGG